jgi:glucose-1-phosphate adenylyltransferase
MEKLLTMIMAGGKGERLYPLTKEKAKPAVTFGGTYKIIDFTLSNCLNSGIHRIYLLTQYSNASLDKHIRLAWNIFRHELGEFLDNIPPQKLNVDWWYRGTADSIYQNINILERERPHRVLILSGDHLYKMDYRKMLDFHEAVHSDVTIACVELSVEKSREMGIVAVDESYRVVGFQEKPARPKPLPHDPTKALVNMGVYIFNTELLVREVIYDAKQDSQHDFGRNILPRLYKKHNVYAYNFRDEQKQESKYWRDVGTLDSYYEANLELLEEKPVFDLYAQEWPIRTYQEQAPPAKILASATGSKPRRGEASNSLIPNGCVITNAQVRHSVLSPFVNVDNHALVEDAIILRGAHIGHHARIRKAIIDEEIAVPPHYSIGFDLKEDAKRFSVTEQGVVVVPQGTILD